MRQTIFSDDFINKLSENSDQGIHQICVRVLDEIAYIDDWSEAYEDLLEALALLMSFAEKHDLEMEFPEIRGSSESDAQNLAEFFSKLKERTSKTVTKIELKQLKQQFDKRFGTIFVYEFSQGDLDRIQQLANELRNIVSSSKELDESYRQRLLARLERFQSELHKKMSDMDRCWGLIGEAGIAVGKFGSDIKPFVDRMKELAQIFWGTQTRAEELPTHSEPPLRLPESTNDGDKE